VADSPSFGNNFVSAVGPTLQVNSNTAAQIFYVKSLLSPGTGLDKLTVTYSLNGTATNANSSGCVFVEYQGADPNNPLDSVSAGYGYAKGSLYDSGTAAPSNANLLVFGGGTSDATIGGTINAEPGFSPIVTNGNSITEQFINTSSPNSTLQRAQATLTGVPAGGNWLMQMAIFRDASWTVGGGWSPARPPQIVNAAQYPGSDPCAQAVAAEMGNLGAHVSVPLTTPGGIIRMSFRPAIGIYGIGWRHARIGSQRHWRWRLAATDRRANDNESVKCEGLGTAAAAWL
jgi:hypothetical protein